MRRSIAAIVSAVANAITLDNKTITGGCRAPRDSRCRYRLPFALETASNRVAARWPNLMIAGCVVPLQGATARFPDRKVGLTAAGRVLEINVAPKDTPAIFLPDIMLEGDADFGARLIGNRKDKTACLETIKFSGLA